MSSEPISPSPDPDLNAIEEALGSLVPARSRIDRDLLMFRAGQASMRPSPRRLRVSNAIAASVALIAIGEGVLLAHRPPTRIVERVVLVREPATAPVDPSIGQSLAGASLSLPRGGPFSLGQTDYERLAGQVLRYGLDGLPASPPVSASISEPWPASAGGLSSDDLHKILDSGDPS